MDRPKTIPAKQKLEEANFIRGRIADSGYTQEEVAGFLGTKQTAISPWLSKKTPNAIPDWQFLRLADILSFDPSETRPWLLQMYLISDRVFKRTKKNRANTADLLTSIIDTMTPEEAYKAAGAIEEAARRMQAEVTKKQPK